jgi:flagellar biosynthesis protein FlhF
MRLKSYFAQSIGDAIESARQELGPEAMLLNSRKTSPEQSYLGEFEVVFGVAGNPPVAKKPAQPAERPVASKLLSATRIFPDLISVEEDEIEEPGYSLVDPIEAPVERVFPQLLKSELKKPELDDATIQAVSSERMVEARPVEKALIPRESPVTRESPVVREASATREVPAVTKPLFSKPAAAAAALPTPPAAAAAPIPAPAAIVTKAAAVAAASPSVEKAVESQGTPDIAFELSELRKQLQAVSQSIAEGLEARWNEPRKASVVDHLFSRLLAFDFSEEFARDLIGSAAQSKMSEYESILRNANNTSPTAPAPSSKSILTQVKSRFTVEPGVGKNSVQRKIVMFVGPPGAGKTTSIVKLAVQLGLEQELPIHLLSLDTLRVAGSEQLNAFGRILGVGFTALHTPEALTEALEEHRDKKIVFIDTPGYAAADKEEMDRAALFFRNHDEIEVQLVLPATLRTSSLRKFVARFAAFEPSKIVYTHLDEVDTLGPVIENTIAAGLPISFLADGQSVPQDLHEATKDRLLQGLFANTRAASV